jgi:hypothetical protein
VQRLVHRREQEVQRDEAHRPDVVDAGQRFVRRPDQVSADHRGETQQQGRGHPQEQPAPVAVLARPRRRPQVGRRGRGSGRPGRGPGERPGD